MSVSLDDFDEWEAELAKVKLQDSSPLPAASQDGDAQLEDSSDSDGDDCAELREPASLQLLRTAIERRERAAEEFGKDWQRFCLEVAAAESPRPAPPVASDPHQPQLPSEMGVSPNSLLLGLLDCVPEGRRNGIEAGARQQHDGVTAGVAADAQSVVGFLRGADRASVSKGGSSDGKESGHTTESREHSGGAPVMPLAACWQIQECSSLGGTDTCRFPDSTDVEPAPDGPVDNGHLTDEYCAQETTLKASKALPGATEEEARRKLEEELEDQQRRALAELDEELARTAAERQAEIVEAAEEQRLLDEETEAAYQRLELARREAAERKALQEATLAALRQEQLDLARWHMAAWRIGRAWQSYRQGPVRHARLAAIVRIQAAWRGHVDRRSVSRLRSQRAIFEAVEEAIREGKPEVIASAVCRAQDIGLHERVRARLAELDAAVSHATANLRAAASAGTYMEYRAASTAAQAFPSLAPLMTESSALFEERRTDAEAAIWAAVVDEPMPSFYRLLDLVSPLGIQSQRLTAAIEAVRQRDEQLIVRLAAGSRAQGASFNAAEFQALTERALRLGLKGDAAAARLVVERRRRSFAAALRTRGSTLSGAAEFLRMAKEARWMGMAVEAEGLMQQLRGRQGDVQVALRLGVAEGSTARVVVLLQHALMLHVPAAVLKDFSQLLRDRQSTWIQTLADATTSASLYGFLAARGAGVHGGVDLRGLLVADRALATKRDAAALSLMQATGDIRSILEGCPPSDGFALAEVLAQVVRLGSTRAVLKRAAETTSHVSHQLTSRPVESAAERTLQLRAGGRRQQQEGHPEADGLVHRSHPADAPSPATRRAAPCAHSPLWPPDVSSLLDVVNRVAVSNDGQASSVSSGEVNSALVVGWPCLTSAVQLGLSGVACLALCILHLHNIVRLAAGSHGLRAAVVERNYWGVPLPPANPGARVQAAWRPSVAFRVGPSTTGNAPSGRCGDEGADEFLERVVSLLRRHRDVIAVRPWVPPIDLLAMPPLPPAKRNMAVLATTRAPAPLCSSPMVPPRFGPKSSAMGGQESRIQAIILRNVPEAALRSRTRGAACLSHLFRLDVGLERLTSLRGLDSLCPTLRVLSADANRLSSLEGLAGLVGLQELSLKHNQLASLLRVEGGQALPALPLGRCLRQLALDSNKLSGELKGLGGCCGLRSLSLADNAITDVGVELESCAPVLAHLILRSNCLASLHTQLASVTSLRELDVSGNRLTSLEGLQGLLLLQTLHASRNAITVLPRPLCLPHLTSLDLGQNSLTAFPDLEGSSAAATIVLPALQRLILQENNISVLGPLGPMPHLVVLDLSFNSLAFLDTLHALVHLSGLRKLNISNNPVIDRMQHGAGLLRQCPGAASVCGNCRQGEWPPLITATSEWALPALQEIGFDEVVPLQRLASTVWATAVSPACAAAGTRQTQAAGTCYVVHHTRAPMAATTGFGRQPRAAGIGRLVTGVWRPHVRLCGNLSSPADPVAVRSLLAATAYSLGSAAICGLHAEAVSAVRASIGRPVSDGPGMQPQPTAEGSLTINGKGRSHPAAASWLTRLETLWSAAEPSDTLEMHIRQLAFAQCVGMQNGNVLMASEDASLGMQLLQAKGGGLATTSQLGDILQHEKADLVDFRAIRHLRPAARFAKCTAFAGVTNVPLASTTDTADTQEVQHVRERNCGDAAVWAVGVEGHGRLEACAAQLGHQLVKELKQLLQHESTELTGDLRIAPARDPQPFLTARPSYFLGRMLQDASVAVTLIQASWRGLCVRRSFPLLRLNAGNDKVSHQSAATTIQAWWRGCFVRRSGLLFTLRQEAKWRHAELCRREAAVTTIQAHFRGRLIRKRLHAALAAVRLPSCSQNDPDLLLVDSGELDNMLQGLLTPLEKLLDDDTSRPRTGMWPDLITAPLPGIRAESPQGPRVGLQGFQSAADAQFLGHGSLPSAAQLISSMPSEPAFELYPAVMAGQQLNDQGHYMGPLGHFSGPGCIEQPFQLLKAAPLLSPPPESFPSGLLPSISIRSSMLHSAHLAAAIGRPSYNTSVEHLSPQSLPEGDLFSLGFGGVQHSNGASTSESTCGEHGVLMQDRELRQERHTERLQKLMVEWGFKDLATAEVYYRRSLRQKQAQLRRNVQAKYQDHAQRRPLPQQRLEPHEQPSTTEQPSGGLRRPTMMRQRMASNPSAASCREEPSGTAAARQRNLNSADGVLVGGYEHPAGEVVSRSSSQGDGSGFRSADSVSTASSGRQILAPLGAVGTVGAIKQPCKVAVVQRPHHLPALASNNWIASSSLQPEVQGMSALQVAGRAAVKPNPVAGASRWKSEERPGTVQSVDSTPEVVMM